MRSCSGDIDIPVILTGTFGTSEGRVVFDNGTGKSRKRIRIDNPTMSILHQKALDGFHAFTGNDYASSFLRKTKKLWKSIVKDDDEMLDFFSNLGSGTLKEELYNKEEKVVCRMYGDKNVESVNKMIAKLFWSRLRKDDKVTDLSHLRYSRCKNEEISAEYVFSKSRSDTNEEQDKRKNDDDTEDQNKNSDGTEDQNKNSDDTEDQNKNSDDTEDQIKNSDDFNIEESGHYF